MSDEIVATAEAKAREHLAEMTEWATGRKSHWNDYARESHAGDGGVADAMCAIADAAEVVKQAAAAQAYAALIGTRVTFDG